MDALVQINDVTKRYDGSEQPAVDGITLEIAAGEAVAVMGPSGSGKSTLLNLIAGLDRPTSGMITVAGKRIDRLTETGMARCRRRQIGMIFQFFNLLDDLTVADNVLLPAQLAGMPRSDARARVNELLAALHIEHHRDAYPGRLSGGERQRVAIARALVNRPAVLLADEPTGALDTATGEEIGRLLLELNRSGQTLVMVTHNPELAARYTHRAVHLIDGRIARRTGDPLPLVRAAEVAVMRLGAVLRAVRGGIGRRRLVQTIVIALVLVVSTASSVLGLALVADSHAPFDHAFSAQRGAHVVARSTPRARRRRNWPPPRASRRWPPRRDRFAETNVTATDSSPGCAGGPSAAHPGRPDDARRPGRRHHASRTATGRSAAGQIVMETNTDGFGAGIGDTVTVTSAPGKPRLTVVGLATSVSRSADAWVVPDQISALSSPGTPATAEMLYRFHSAGTASAVSAGTAAVTRALPAGAVTGTQSYLDVRAAQHDQVAVYAPFVVAFAIIGLVMSVLIVANVVSGAVIAGYYRIGILKSIGFTPGQVIAAYTGQAIMPAVAGCLGGVALGNLLSVPLLRKTADVYGVGRLGVPLWVNVAVPLAMCGLVALAAVLPALRGWPAQRDAGPGCGSRPTHGPRLSRAPPAGPAGFAPAGDDRPRVTVRPPGADGGDARGGSARRYRRDLRRRARHLAQARRG